MEVRVNYTKPAIDYFEIRLTPCEAERLEKLLTQCERTISCTDKEFIHELHAKVKLRISWNGTND